MQTHSINNDSVNLESDMEYSPSPERVHGEDFEYITIPQQIEEPEPEPDSAGETVCQDDPSIKVILPKGMETSSTINT